MCARAGVARVGYLRAAANAKKARRLVPVDPKIRFRHCGKIHWVNRAILHFLTTAGREGKPEKLR